MESKKVIAKNKRAAFEYFFLEIYECGIVLTGTEIIPNPTTRIISKESEIT